jgi:hypothetical protein
MGEEVKNQVNRRPGRPRAIPRTLIPRVLTLYQGGLGYRAIARELRADGISVDWSTVRRLIKARIDVDANRRHASDEF